MACGNEQIRFIVKTSTTSGEKPTIPPSDNHTDGSWIATDIYKGELFFNQADGIMWTRADIDGTDVIITIDGYTNIYKAVMNQSGANAPIAYHVQSSFSSAIAWTRTGTGVYLATLASSFPAFRTLVLIPDQGQVTGQVHYEWVDANSFRINTFSGGVAADGVMTKMGIFIGILPIQDPAS